MEYPRVKNDKKIRHGKDISLKCIVIFKFLRGVTSLYCYSTTANKRA